MVRKTVAVEDALLKKGMQRDENHHHMFRLSIDGVAMLVTRMSHGSNEIDNSLGKLMANQCGLKLKEFWELVDCTLGQADWEKLIAERSTNGKNPFLDR